MCGGRIRKLLVLVVLGAVVTAVVRALRGPAAPQFANHPSVDGGPEAARSAPRAPAAAAEPVAELTAPEPPAGELAAPEPELELAAPEPELELAAGTGTGAWEAPVDGECPPGYPIKAKEKSRIFHQPGGLAYDRTRPDRCYATATDAEADGFRAAKR